MRDERGSFWRGPLTLLFAFGCVVSLLAAGRLTPRLIADGMVSFAFVPVVEVIALTVVSPRTPPGTRVPLARIVDRFFIGYRHWVVWLIAVAAVGAAVPPRELGPWITPAFFGSVVPLAWSLRIDFRFFRDEFMLPAESALRRVVAHRAIAWTGIIGYFLGIALWSEQVPELIEWLRR
jgi:hypothetical protein